jgi:hypothetical protein
MEIDFVLEGNMESFVTIPKAWVLEFDDVGWDNGRDLRLQKKASRSGLPRYHANEDYKQLRDIGEAAGMTINVALCLADWDKDNVLRGFVGATHDPHGWDRASEIDLDAFAAHRDVLEGTEYVDYSIHGLLHGYYDENGVLVHEREYFELSDDGTHRSLGLRSIEDFNRRLDCFFKIYDGWGFKKPIRVFISPCGLGDASHEELSRIAGELYKRGVRYWTNGGFYFKEPMKVINGVACVKKSAPIDENGQRPDAPWDAYDVDPSTFPDYTATNFDGCVFGLHWTNILRFNPKKNPEQTGLWVDYIKRQGELFGIVNAKNIVEAINQQFYYQNAKMTVSDGAVEIDLSAIEAEHVDCHKNEFFISFKNGIEPKSCFGGEISLYEEHREFDTYKVTHTGDKVEILL